jgi:hypothetical protein
VLTWIGDLGNAEVRARLGTKNEYYNLTVSTYQMCILGLFAEKN